MNQKYIYIFLAFLLGAFVVLVSPYAQSPELYTIENGSHTSYHTNPEALKRISQEKSPELMMLMQDVVSSSGTVVLNIRFKDYEEAQEELLEYAKRAQTFDNVVIQLDMTESEIEEFRRLNSQNLASMRELLNDTIRFEELNRLEIRYRAEDDPSMLYSIAYEGETLREKVRENFFGYRSRAPSLIESSTKFGLNTTEYEESVDIFEEIVEEIDSEQVLRNREKPLPHFGEYTLDITVWPDTGRYGDLLNISGTLAGPNPGGKVVNIFIDSQEWASLPADSSGMYAAGFYIGKTRTGVHFIHSVMDSTYSPILSITVEQSDSLLALSSSLLIEGNNITCRGTLKAGAHPVSTAPVILYAREIIPGEEGGYQIVSDAYRKKETTTSNKGEYSCTFTLDPGVYEIQAYFPGDGFPLNESKSLIRSVEVPDEQSGLIPLLLGAGCIGICSLGALYYVRRAKKPRVIQTMADSEKVRISPGEGPAEQRPPVSPPPSSEEIIGRYMALAEQGYWVNAVHILYISLRNRIAEQYAIPNAEVYTPRELLASLPAASFTRILSSFVQSHESIHYGGLVPDVKASSGLLECWTSLWDMMEGDEY
jgi:hypothetical protein